MADFWFEEVFKGMKHTLSVLVENRPGVLVRVAGLFSRRGFNIDSLTVGRTESPDVSRMTIVVEGDDRFIEQVTKQLHKLIDVLKISDISAEEYVDRDLVLIKVAAEPSQRVEIMQMAGVFRARVVDLGRKTMTLECTGNEGKINAFEESLRPYGIKELVRTGKVAMLRGSKLSGERDSSGGKRDKEMEVLPQ
jgi:acetolactate synthase-1/3 small subunit